jgi:hypothetical protein
MPNVLLHRIVAAGLSLATAVMAVAPCRADAADAELILGSIDTYGSGRWSTKEVQSQFTDDFRNLVAAMSRRDGDTIRPIQKRILDRVLARGWFPYVEIAAIQSAAPHSRVDFTIDLVEPQDVPRRMPFRRAPTENISDPDGLLGQWTQYERTAFPLAMAGKLEKGDECPVWHCAYTFSDPALVPYLEVFNRGALKHKEALSRIAVEDADQGHRKIALYLLVHAGDATHLVQIIERAMLDPRSEVRNAALRILMMMIPRVPQLRYPVADLVRALDFPATTDRNKAGWALVELARDEETRSYIRAHALPTLLKNLRLEQPINHEPAYELLKLVSGESFGDRDYKAWQTWVAQASR